MNDFHVRQIADDFWKRAGRNEDFPRSLEAPIAWSLPLGIFKLPSLTTDKVNEWTKALGLLPVVTGTRRRLHACLIAHRGKGCILMDGTDPEDERRFSLAHEASHFMFDYLIPRERVISRLGNRVIQVLDGFMPPTNAERVDAILCKTPLSVHFHLMHRNSNGSYPCARIGEAEFIADRLAMELLAPECEVKRRVEEEEIKFDSHISPDDIMGVLKSVFGLPHDPASVYALFLKGKWTKAPSLREWLGLSGM